MSNTVLEGWILDFYRLRGDLAHGRLNPKRSPIWNLREHLLLGAYLFPLVVKCRLAQENKYIFTEDDYAGINAFEALACTTMFDSTRDDTDDSPWRELRRDARFSALIDRAISEVEESGDP